MKTKPLIDAPEGGVLEGEQTVASGELEELPPIRLPIASVQELERAAADRGVLLQTLVHSILSNYSEWCKWE